MSKQSKQSSTPPFSENHWSDHPAAEWISDNKQLILWTLAAIFALLIILARLLMGRNAHAESDYFKAQTDFTQFQADALNPAIQIADSKSLNDLESIMNQYPELHAKYDGPIAQTLIIENQIAKAEPFAKATFQRTKNDHIKNYHEFAKTSLLVGEGEYQKALENAEQLQETLKADLQKNRVSTLYIFNLLRLAMLHQQLGNTKQETQIWEEFQLLAPQTDAAKLLEIFSIGNANLNQFIQKRKN